MGARVRLVQNHLCGVREIAQTFHVSEKSVRQWLKEGFPAVLIGGKWQCRYEECWEWVKSRKNEKVVK